MHQAIILFEVGVIVPCLALGEFVWADWRLEEDLVQLAFLI